MPYEVHTAVFEGPFDLLLHLIVREQVDVYQVSLARIVDAYLTEMERMGALDLEVATEFLLIAATLVELKTRRLLPGLDDPESEEELALLEERDLLLARLLECKTFRDAGVALVRLAQHADLSHPRMAGLEDRFLELVPDVLAGIKPADLHAAFLRATQPKPLPPKVDLEHVAPIRVSVADAVEAMVDRLPELGRTTFRHLTRNVDTRLDLIVGFLAVLELYKQGRIDVEQHATFGELSIVWTGEGEAGEITSDTGDDVGDDTGDDLGHDIDDDLDDDDGEQPAAEPALQRG